MDLVVVLTLITQVAIFLLILTLVFRMSPLALGLRVIDQLVRNISGAPVARLSRITPQLYVGGQHHKRGWAKMQNMGITAVVNMRETHHDDHAKGIAPEHYLHLPTIDNTPPSMTHLHAGVAFITEEIANGGQVYIHCASGFHRAPTMAIAYFISTGLTFKESLSMIKRVRPFARPIRSQKQQLEQFEREIRTNN